MQVYINKKGGGRQLVNCELIEDRKYTVKVRLAGGDVIIRKKNRDLFKNE